MRLLYCKLTTVMRVKNSCKVIKMGLLGNLQDFYFMRFSIKFLCIIINFMQYKLFM